MDMPTTETTIRAIVCGAPIWDIHGGELVAMLDVWEGYGTPENRRRTVRVSRDEILRLRFPHMAQEVEIHILPDE